MYVQTFQTPSKEPLSLLPLLERETKVTHIILASLHLHDVPGEIRLNDHKLSDPYWSQLWLEKMVLQHRGIKVMALLGGAAGGTYKRLNGSDASVSNFPVPILLSKATNPLETEKLAHPSQQFYAFYNPLLRVLREYSFDGIDLDIEEDVDISTPIRLMTALRRDLGPDFIITMAPLASALSDKLGQNLSGFSYFDLDMFATMPGSDEKLVSWYNGLFYGGFARGPPFFESVVQAGWDPNRVVMVVLDCAEDGQPNGFVHIETLQETIKDLRGLHPSLGGIGGWEYHDAGMSDCR